MAAPPPIRPPRPIVDLLPLFQRSVGDPPPIELSLTHPSDSLPSSPMTLSPPRTRLPWPSIELAVPLLPRIRSDFGNLHLDLGLLHCRPAADLLLRHQGYGFQQELTSLLSLIPDPTRQDQIRPVSPTSTRSDPALVSSASSDGRSTRLRALSPGT